MKKIKLAIIATCPATTILPEGRFKSRYVGREHPSPWVTYLAGALAERDDIELCVFTYTRAVERTERIVDGGISYVFVPKLIPGQLDPYLMHIPEYLTLRKEIRAFKPDIIQGCGTESGNAYLATRFSVPSVMFIQGIAGQLASFNNLSAFSNGRRIHYENKAFMKVTGVIGETGFALRYAESINPRNRKTVIPHGVSDAFFSVDPTYEPRFLVVGTLSRTKGSDVVLDAFISSMETHDCELVFVGDGPFESELKEKVKAAGAEERVRFAGRLNRSEIIEQMTISRALIIASRMDTSPNVVTEAHAAGLPVLGSDAGGIPDMIDAGVDGYIVPAEQVSILSETITHFAKSVDACREMGLAGRNKVKVLNDPARIAEQHMDFYKDVLESKG